MQLFEVTFSNVYTHTKSISTQVFLKTITALIFLYRAFKFIRVSAFSWLLSNTCSTYWSVTNQLSTLLEIATDTSLISLKQLFLIKLANKLQRSFLFSILSKNATQFFSNYHTLMLNLQIITFTRFSSLRDSTTFATNWTVKIIKINNWTNKFNLLGLRCLFGVSIFVNQVNHSL